MREASVVERSFLASLSHRDHNFEILEITRGVQTSHCILLEQRVRLLIGSSRLTPENLRCICQRLQLVRKRTHGSLVIRGHTSTIVLSCGL